MHKSRSNSAFRLKTAILILMALLLVPLAASCHDTTSPMTRLAEGTCAELDGAKVADAQVAMDEAISLAEEQEVTANQLREQLEDKCPQTVPMLDLLQVAKETCDELDGAIVLQVGGILSRAIGRAEDAGFSAPDLGDVMRAKCPDMMAAVNSISEDQQEREALPSKMRVKLDTCYSDKAVGSVTNNSNVTVEVFVEVQFLDDKGTVIDDGIDSVSGLRPGETGKWEAPYLGDSSYATCRADVTSAFEK